LIKDALVLQNAILQLPLTNKFMALTAGYQKNVFCFSAH